MTGNRITVTVTDQYGDPIGNIPVTASSAASAPTADPGRSVFPAKARVTFPDGTVTHPLQLLGHHGRDRDGHRHLRRSGLARTVMPLPGNADDPTDLTANYGDTSTGRLNGTSTTAADGTDTPFFSTAALLLAAKVDNNLIVLNVSGVPTV